MFVLLFIRSMIRLKYDALIILDGVGVGTTGASTGVGAGAGTVAAGADVDSIGTIHIVCQE